MPDLTPEQVRGLLRAMGVEAAEDDVTEVTHRVNALREAIEGVEAPGLDEVEPLPIFWLREGR